VRNSLVFEAREGGKAKPALALMQIRQAEAAPVKGLSSFPQASAHVWKVDPSIAHKTQDIVVLS